MLKIGVLGAGHLGKIHIRLLKEIEAFELIGFHDQDAATAAKVSSDFDIPHYENIEQLINDCDAIDVVTPTISHFECAEMAIKKSKHVFIEKPLADTLEHAKQLVDLAKEANIIAQVGHVERFNPAFMAISDELIDPMFIEAHRLASFNPRGTDVSVVLDLMIHDIDIILSVVKSNVKRISASGIPVISNKPDICNARIEFDNACVANITASRISMKQMRKIRMFQKDTYLSVDLLEKKTEIFRLNKKADESNPMSFEIETGVEGEKKFVSYKLPEIKESNAIKTELECFARSILGEIETPVSLLEGYNALKVAYQILEKIEKNRLA
ncbi:MAG: Gfo/Idh/MocA family oxidoreductase [Chitinophagales bacterium]